jgi:serine/threonine-protein kinase
MERLRGTDLADLLLARGRLGIEESVRWVIDTCEAMSEAHARGVMHRDLKPSNLFLASTPHGPVLKVLDFGLARAVLRSSKLTGTHTAIGTPHYMSPEQAQGEHADQRTDIYALGCILFELVTRDPSAPASRSCSLTSAVLSPSRASASPPSRPASTSSSVR